jgi:hypothetical protein
MKYDESGNIIEFESGIRRTKERTTIQLRNAGAISVKTVKTNNDLILKYKATFKEGILDVIVLLRLKDSTNGCLNNEQHLNENFTKILGEGRNPLIFISDVRHERNHEPIHELFNDLKWSTINPPFSTTPCAVTPQYKFKTKEYLRETIDRFFNTKIDNSIVVNF